MQCVAGIYDSCLYGKQIACKRAQKPEHSQIENLGRNPFACDDVAGTKRCQVAATTVGPAFMGRIDCDRKGPLCACKGWQLK
jgi:hypothetical protein